MASADSQSRRRLPGTQLGRYVLGPELGVGAAAIVYLGIEQRSEVPRRVLALKVIHEHLVDQQESVDLFLDEAKVAVRLSHPNVVRVFELGRDGPSLFMAMEYLHGQPLAALYHRLIASKVQLPCDVIAWLGAQAAEGLQHAHELTDESGMRLALVHRDVSPQNLFVGYDGSLKVIDFGIARAEGRLAKTAQGKIRGKFRYMAPEQLLGAPFDQRVDVFALGAALYELTVNAALFDAKDLPDMLNQIVEAEMPDPRERRAEVPEEMVRILRKALALEPDNRYATAAEMARDLNSIVACSAKSDQHGQLARHMEHLFPEEIQKHGRQVSQMQSMIWPPALIVAPTRLAQSAPHPVAASRPPAPTPRSIPGGWLLAATIVLSIGLSLAIAAFVLWH